MEIPITNPALVIVDMQNSFCHKEGFLGRAGFSVDMSRSIIPKCKDVLQVFREEKLPVIYTHHAFRPDYKDGGIYVKHLFPIAKQLEAQVQDTWDVEIVSELNPRADEIVIRKHRYSGFYQTDMELVLRGLGVETLILTGVATNVCVESTARDAVFRDFKVVVVSDGTATVDEEMHTNSLKTIQFAFGDVKSSDEIVKTLKGGSDSGIQ